MADSSLYPAVEPYNAYYLPVSALHTLYVEEVGNPNGIPILYLHGGPGGRSWPEDRQLFDPKKFRVILYHQRGCGWSKPAGCVQQNRTPDLIQDIERIRQHLSIDQWHLTGGSWGTTLALAYTQTYPKKVLSLILRGAFFARPEELTWLYQEGAAWHSPLQWARFTEWLPETEQTNLIEAYHRRLFDDSQPELQQEAAKRWFDYECGLGQLNPEYEFFSEVVPEDEVRNVARLECHYFYHQGFFTAKTSILKAQNLKALENISIKLVHGRYDYVCPLKNAWDLKKGLPHIDLQIAEGSGHAQSEANIQSQLIQWLDEIAN